MKSLVAILLLVLDGGEPTIVQVDRGALVQLDGGIADVRGGTWFSTPEVVEMGRDHDLLRVENEKLKASAAEVPYEWIVAAALTGLALGVASTLVGMKAAGR